MSAFVATVSGRLDCLLVKEGAVRSRAEAQRMIEGGLVRVRGRAVKKSSCTVREGDRVEYVRLQPPATDDAIEPVDLRLAVLYEDATCLVIDKPAGIAVHRGAGMKPGTVTVLHGAAFLFRERGLPFSAQSVLVHRLDQETTGCLLLAKTPEVHGGLQRQFAERRVRKTYLALVAGVPTHPRAIIDAPIGRHPLRPTRMTVLGGRKSREARSTYEILVQGERCALLQCDIATGRTHQVRVHLSAIGHPLLGDRTYRNALSDRLREQHGIPSLCLHAWKLAFVSPADQREHEVLASVPAGFREAMRKAGVVFPPPTGEPACPVCRQAGGQGRG